jgi:hypothetical protein
MATTYDDMDGVNVDTFYTYDDPLGNYIISSAFALGTITRDGPQVTVDWSGSGNVLDGLVSPLIRDNFSVVNGSGLSPTDYDGITWSTSTGWSSDGESALQDVAAVNTTYRATLSGVSTRDFDVMAVCVLVGGFPLGDRVSGLLFARYVDANNHLQFRYDFNISGILGYNISVMLSGVLTSLFSGLINTGTYVLGDSYWLRAQGQGSMIRLKIWNTNVFQPDDWTITTADTTLGLPGSVGIGAFLAAANTNTLPYRLAFSQFWNGLNRVVDNGRISLGKSLDDGMPSGATDTGNLGVTDGSTDLAAPIGVRHDVYYSEFRTDQILHDINRDVAGLNMVSGVVASDGVRQRRVFTGQMASMSVEDDSVAVSAISKNRLKLSTVVQPPAVHGVYEGAEATWVIGYALWKSGLLNAPPVLAENGCRVYMPMNGSLRSYLPDNNYQPFQAGVVRTNTSGARYVRPTFVDGPMPGSAAPFLSITHANTLQMQDRDQNIKFGPGADFWSQTSCRGRIEVWFRSDNTDVAGSFAPAAGDYIDIQIRNSGGTRFLKLGLSTAARLLYGNYNDGTFNTSATKQFPIPADGQWHFLGFSWNLPEKRVGLVIDNQTTNFFIMSQDISNLPLTDDISEVQISAFLPIAELRISSGLMSPSEYTSWAPAQVWSRDVEMRRSLITLDSVSEPAPREAFELIQSFAQGELARIGFGDNDEFRYLSLPYFGELEQQVPFETLATDVNLGRDFKPVRDVTRIYNQIALSYKQTSANENWSKVVDTSQLITIPSGWSEITFSTSVPVIEIRSPSTGLAVMSGAALAAAPPSESNAINYITANAVIDGTGTNLTAAQLSAFITAWTPGSVTVRFYSSFAGEAFVANNVNISPLSIAAKTLVVVDASIAAQADDSVVIRGTRTLRVTLPGVQTYADALATARELASRLAWPRVAFTSSVFGDARRTPAQLVTVSDPGRTNLAGNFRLTNVSITQEQEDMQQTIAAEQAWSVFTWGVSSWGESVWGEG